MSLRGNSGVADGERWVYVGRMGAEPGITTVLGAGSARFAALAFVVMASAACGGKAIVVEREFPEPLLDALPLRVGVVYDEELRNFSFLDTTIDGATWSVDLGSSNVRLFDQIFDAMFADTVSLDSVAATQNLDAIIAPIIEEYAFLAPSESGSKFWAVSIRYRMELYDANGEMLTDWPVIAYGKSRSKLLKGAESLAEATNYALRDAAAALATQIPEKPEVIAMLGQPPPPDAVSDETITNAIEPSND